MGQKALCLAGILVLSYFLVNMVTMSAAQNETLSTTPFTPTTNNGSQTNGTETNVN